MIQQPRTGSADSTKYQIPESTSDDAATSIMTGTASKNGRLCGAAAVPLGLAIMPSHTSGPDINEYPVSVSRPARLTRLFRKEPEEGKEEEGEKKKENLEPQPASTGAGGTSARHEHR
ncbi:hypothetical protein CIB48_g11308 [Xylaria polymorpha]|nr:hypothetical protein CIB48_g11308 [Xylaria polymorpha]